VVAMHERCTPRTLRRRYPTGPATPTAARLGRLLDPARAGTLVAEVAAPGGERVVAMATLAGEGAQVDLALIIEDGWQGRGLGTALLRRLGTLAAKVGYAALDGPMIEHDGGVVTVTLPLDPREAPVARHGVDSTPGPG